MALKPLSDGFENLARIAAECPNIEVKHRPLTGLIDAARQAITRPASRERQRG